MAFSFEEIHKNAAAKAEKWDYLSPNLECLLLVLTEDPEAIMVFKALNVDPQKLQAELTEVLHKKPDLNAEPAFGDTMIRAKIYKATRDENVPPSVYILLSMVQERGSDACHLLAKHNVTRQHINGFIMHGVSVQGTSVAPFSEEARLLTSVTTFFPRLGFKENLANFLEQYKQ